MFRIFESAKEKVAEVCAAIIQQFEEPVAGYAVDGTALRDGGGAFDATYRNGISADGYFRPIVATTETAYNEWLQKVESGVIPCPHDLRMSEREYDRLNGDPYGTLAAEERRRLGARQPDPDMSYDPAQKAAAHAEALEEDAERLAYSEAAGDAHLAELDAIRDREEFAEHQAEMRSGDIVEATNRCTHWDGADEARREQLRQMDEEPSEADRQIASSAGAPDDTWSDADEAAHQAYLDALGHVNDGGDGDDSSDDVDDGADGTWQEDPRNYRDYDPATDTADAEARDGELTDAERDVRDEVTDAYVTGVWGNQDAAATAAEGAGDNSRGDDGDAVVDDGSFGEELTEAEQEVLWRDMHGNTAGSEDYDDAYRESVDEAERREAEADLQEQAAYDAGKYNSGDDDGDEVPSASQTGPAGTTTHGADAAGDPNWHHAPEPDIVGEEINSYGSPEDPRAATQAASDAVQQACDTVNEAIARGAVETYDSSGDDADCPADEDAY